MRWIVFDCPSGAAGDMTLGALVDLGVPVDVIRDALATLPIRGWTLRAEKVERSSIAATQVHVEIEAAAGGAHAHRHPFELLEILKAGRLPARARGWAAEAFLRLARAEAEVHGMSIGDVHFHEVGAIDAIVDVAGACIGFDWLCHERDVGGIRVSQLRVGRGTVRTEHGRMAVPPPAVLRLLEGYAIEWSAADGERLTPTGAALLATLARPLGSAAVRVERTGYGAGTMQFPDAPNVLRLVQCEPAAATAADLPAGMDIDAALDASRAGDHAQEHARGEAHVHGHSHTDHDHDNAHTHAESHAAAAPGLARTRVAVLRTQIDDMVPELYGHVMARLFAAGALDVYWTPIQMKKDRPATAVTVVARPEDAERLAGLVLEETTTLGVRVAFEERIELPRRSAAVRTPYGRVAVKIATLPGGVERVVPEFESARVCAEAARIPLAEVYRAALRGEPESL